MFERLLFKAEKRINVLQIMLYTVIITVLLGIVNIFIGGNALFLVALDSLALSYPVVNYVRSMDREELKTRMEQKTLLRRHSTELIVFWSIFIAAVIGMAVVFPFQKDFTSQESFLHSVTGNATHTSSLFKTILLNNIRVLVLTFIISLISFSALLFVLFWNASILVYSLSKFTSISAAVSRGVQILPHGLIEIGGYVMAGIAGSIIAYRVDRWKKFDHRLDGEFIKDVLILMIGSVLLVVVGAMIEAL